MPDRAKGELTFTPIELKFPSATWREILASKVDKIVVGFCAVFLDFLLMYCILGKALEKSCCEVLSSTLTNLEMELKERNISNLQARNAPKKMDYCLPPKPDEKIPDAPPKPDEKIPDTPPKNVRSPNTSNLQVRSRKEPDYVIIDEMKATLEDWLIEVHRKFELRHETFSLTINLAGEFLSLTKVSREDLQLVGIASIIIACRYEEIRSLGVPTIKDLLESSDEGYEREEVLAMEKDILWKLLPPPPYLHTRYAPADHEMEFNTELARMGYFNMIEDRPLASATSPSSNK